MAERSRGAEQSRKIRRRPLSGRKPSHKVHSTMFPVCAPLVPPEGPGRGAGELSGLVHWGRGGDVVCRSVTRFVSPFAFYGNQIQRRPANIHVCIYICILCIWADN